MHIWLDINAHGFGHASQCIPLIKALQNQGHSITIMSALPRTHWTQRNVSGVNFVEGATTPDWQMREQFKVDRAASWALFMSFHDGFPQKIDNYTVQLKAAKVDLVISNISYLAPMAAMASHIPCLTFSSLQWADLFCYFFDGYPDMERHHMLMLDGYRTATQFARLEPGMPMPDLPKAQAVAPYCTMGANRRAELLAHYHLPQDVRLVLFGFGGIDPGIAAPVAEPPQNQFWFLPHRWVLPPRCAWVDEAPYPYIDLLASSDLLVTKPGYGALTEAGCMGIPTLNLAREDWPEAPYLVKWLGQHTRCKDIAFADFSFTAMGDYLAQIEKLPQPVAAKPNGLNQLLAITNDLLNA